MSDAPVASRYPIVVCGATDTVRSVVSALSSGPDARALGVPIVTCEPVQNGSDKRPFLEALRNAGVCVLAVDGATGWSTELRQLCLLAFRFTGIAPVIAVAGGEGAAAIATGWREMEILLGLPPTTTGVVDLTKHADALVGAVATAQKSVTAALATAISARLAIAEPKAAETPTRKIAGALLSGTFEPGLKVVLLPSAQSATVAACSPADAAGNVTVELDTEVVIGTDTVLSAADRRPEQADQVVAHMVWIGRKPMLPGRTYNVRIAGQTSTAQVSTLKHKVDPVSLNPIAARRLEQGSVGLCNVSFSDSLVFDIEGATGQAQLPTRRFVLEDRIDGGVVGIGDIVFTLRRATNIHWQALAVDKAARATLKQQRPGCLWFTGLSGSGKSTVASLLEKRLNAMGRHTYTLDGDNVRHGLNRDLGFTDADRVENIRRVGEVSKLMVDAGLLVMVSFISPFRAERRMARSLFPAGEFLEIFVDTPIDVCEQRDPKGLYKKARSGQLKNFTGIDSPYEPPEQAEILLPGGEASPEELVERVLADLMRRGMV